MENRKRRARRARLLYATLAAVSAVARRLPLGVVRAFGASLGHIAFYLGRRDRRIAMDNLAIAFPDWSARRRRVTVRRMSRHLGASMLEVAWLPRLDRAMLAHTTEIRGREQIDRALAAGRGVVIFGAHCGNWEWLGVTLALLGHPVTVVQREREGDLNRFITELRAGFGIRTVDRGSGKAARDMFRTLRNGGLLGFLIDQNIRAESIAVPFFDRPALTPVGPAKLAIRAEAPVMLAFIERRGGRQIVRFEEPRFTTRSSSPEEITAWLTTSIEAQIRRVPEQWVWFHDRWRERDSAPNGETDS